MNNEAFNSIIKEIVVNPITKAEFSEDLTFDQLEIIAETIKESFYLEHVIFKKMLTDDQLKIIASSLKENMSIVKIDMPKYSLFYNRNILIQLMINYELQFDCGNPLLWDLKQNPAQPFANVDDFFYCYEQFPLLAVWRDNGLQFLLQNLSEIDIEAFRESIKTLFCTSIIVFKLYEHPIKLPENYLSVEQFIGLITISKDLADLITAITDFSQQINSPDDIISILKINRPLGEKIIYQNKDLQEIIKIHNLAEKYPEYLSPPKVIKKDFTKCGLMDSDEYHEKLLYQIGYIYCRDFINLTSPMNSLYIPFAKMIIDVLNQKPLNPSIELIKMYILQCERMGITNNREFFYCKSTFYNSSFFSNESTEEMVRMKQKMINLITSIVDLPFYYITQLLLTACNQINVGKYDKSLIELMDTREDNNRYTEVFSKLNNENQSLIENDITSVLANYGSEQRSPRMGYH